MIAMRISVQRHRQAPLPFYRQPFAPSPTFHVLAGIFPQTPHRPRMRLHVDHPTPPFTQRGQEDAPPITSPSVSFSKRHRRRRVVSLSERILGGVRSRLSRRADTSSVARGATVVKQGHAYHARWWLQALAASGRA